MKSIGQKVYSFLSSSKKIGKYSVDQIRKDSGYQINSNKELVKSIAELSYHNAKYSLFYRGQDEDYLNQVRASSLYPTIFRPKKIMSATISLRYTVLNSCEKKLLESIAARKFAGKGKLQSYEEIRWSILQHYRVCRTPLLDISSSLRVAVTFAIQKTGKGILYVLAFPKTHESITYSVEERLLIIDFSRICPPSALRPFFQNAFLVGDFPKARKKLANYDFGNRVIAKFIINENLKFFDKIDNDMLVPNEDDEFYEICSKITKKVPPAFRGDTEDPSWDG